MEPQPLPVDPDIPSGETLLWSGRPSVFRWSQGDGSFLGMALLATFVPAIILSIMLMFALGPLIWPNFRNDEYALMGLCVSPGFAVLLTGMVWLIRKILRRGATRYLITDHSVILIKPYGEFLQVKLRKEKFLFRGASVRSRKIVGQPGYRNIILGRERHFYEGYWFRSSREYWIQIGIKECSEADKAESIIEKVFGSSLGEPLEIRHTPNLLPDTKEESEPLVLEGPSKGSTLFIRGRNAPLVSWFSPKIPVTFANKPDEEILKVLLSSNEVALWTGRADFEPFRELAQFQKFAAIVGLLISPFLIWLGIQIWNLRPSAILIVLGIAIVVWADAILLGRWSVPKIIGRAFYVITDRRVILVHPFGPDLFPFDQPFYSFDQATIAKRVLCECPSGPAIIFQSKETISGNDHLQVENLGIVACPDWHEAELILDSWFDEGGVIEALDRGNH